MKQEQWLKSVFPDSGERHMEENSMNCRILVVDDEPNIAEGIQIMIQREMPSGSVVGLAYDGTQGIAMAMTLKPDIILTDIKMPNLDGIGMIRQLISAGCASRFVILTGYSDFNYAKSAISLGVENYITKPIDKEELFLTIRKIHSDIQKKSEDTKELQRMKDVFQNYGPSMQEYALKRYIETSHAERGEIALFFKEIGMELKAKKYCCAIFENNSDTEERKGEDLFQSVKKKIEKNFGNFSEVFVLHYSDNQAAIILGQEREPDDRRIYHILCRVRAEIAMELDIPVIVGMGTSHEKKEIRLSLKEAKCALNYKVIRGGNAAIHYRDISDITDDTDLIDPADVKKLEICIDNMDDEGCRKTVEEIFHKLETQELSLENLKNISLNLILLGIRKMPYIQFQISEYLGKDIFSLDNLSKFGTIEQLKNWIINTLVGMNDLMIKENMPEKNDVVEAAKKYMSKNLSKNITLNDISEHFFINPYYFSQLFKKRTGENYLDYLTGLRINRAKKLLESTDLKVYEICEMVGYTNINHFNKVFERMVGLKPREYKESLKLVE